MITIEVDHAGTESVSEVNKTLRWWREYTRTERVKNAEKKKNHDLCEYLHIDLSSLIVAETQHVRMGGWF